MPRRRGLGLARALVTAALCVAGVGCGSRSDPLPSFTLTNQSGETVGADTLRGYATVMTFVFTHCPDVCPLLTAQVAQVQAQAKAVGLSSRVRFVSITVDPARDTPDVLSRYAAGYGADLASWHFLTGSPDAVSRVTREIGVLTGVGDRIGHSNLVLFVDPQGRIVERYTGLELDPARMLAKIRRLL